MSKVQGPIGPNKLDGFESAAFSVFVVRGSDGLRRIAIGTNLDGVMNGPLSVELRRQISNILEQASRMVLREDVEGNYNIDELNFLEVPSFPESDA